MEKNRNSILILIIFTLLFGCAHTEPETIPGNTAYIEAVKVPEKAPATKIIEVPKLLPLPNQLKSLKDEKNSVDPDTSKKPFEIIEAANKEASRDPSTYGYFNSIMQYDFSPGALYQIYCAPLKLTDIQLQPGEKISGKPACGDTVRWIMGLGTSKNDGAEQQHIYIKPTRPGLSTTLSINTDHRSYHFEIHSYKSTYMAAVNFRYPHDEIAFIQQQATIDAAADRIVTSPVVSIDKLNFAYEIKVHKGRRPTWLPIKVFDDSKKTFIQFPKDMLNREAPVLFVLSKDNETQLVNYRIRNEFYIVDRLFDSAELRLGKEDHDIIRISRSGAKLENNRPSADNL
jgi:type IV secretion system protein VirB9